MLTLDTADWETMNITIGHQTIPSRLLTVYMLISRCCHRGTVGGNVLNLQARQLQIQVAGCAVLWPSVLAQGTLLAYALDRSTQEQMSTRFQTEMADVSN